MRIVHVASEMFPYVKTGGLADVGGALATALAARGHEVTVFLPGYRAVVESPLAQDARRDAPVRVRLGDNEVAGDIFTVQPRPGLTLHLVARDEFFDRRHLYWNGEREYDDNDARFIFFQKAVLEVLRRGEVRADVVHAHDWQAGLLPLLLRNFEQGYGGTRLAERTVFTIHNIAYQGLFPRRSFALTNLHHSLNAMEGIEFFGRISLLKAGILYADQVTTVSANYAREIQTPEHGHGMEGVVRFRAAALHGIRNGIDTAVWNPARDALLPARFSADDLAGKTTCRERLLAEFGWPAKFAGPVFGMVSRITEAKGHDFVLGAADFFARNDCRLVVLGSGEAKLARALRELAAAHPDKIAVSIRLDEAMSHLVEAGTDFFLMPSRSEPCGLNQMYSLAYGTVPLVSRVGGLVDTVRDIDAEPELGTGIMFEPGVVGLTNGLERALGLWAEPKRLAMVRQRGMRRDFSWESVVPRYEQLYRG
jgi:starch synthase